VGKRQVEQLAMAAAADIDAFYAARRPGPAAGEVLLVLQFDGKGIVMPPEALRPATARALGGAPTSPAVPGVPRCTRMNIWP